MKTDFYNSNGTLTGYALACGYVEKAETDTNKKQMYREHNTFHVRAGKIGERTNIWECFEKLTDARKFYNSIKL